MSDRNSNGDRGKRGDNRVPEHGIPWPRRESAGPLQPMVSRRRELSPGSARSLLMTVLGEFVLPHDRPVWTSALVGALATFGIEEKSARQALARTAAEGWLVAEKVGRRVRWSLTPPARRLLTEGAERIYGFGCRERRWDGTWLVLLVSVPEAKRDLRHRLRTRLSWAGFGSPDPGVWITSDTTREDEAFGVLTELGLGADAMSFKATYGAVGSEEAMVSRAWDLTDLDQRYEGFIGEFGTLCPSPGDPVFRAQTWLVHEWRRFPFLDPRLPRELLPRNFSGVKAAELFHRKHAEWRSGAQRHWAEQLLDEDDD